MTNIFLDRTLFQSDEGGAYLEFIKNVLGQQDQDIGRCEILERLPKTSRPSYGPLATLNALLEILPGPWPVLHLQRAYARSWKCLPENAKAGRQNQTFLAQAFNKCKTSYSSLLDLLHPLSTATAIIEPGSGRALAHNHLSSIVRTFSLPISPLIGETKPVVAISIPNGPLLALTVLATATYYTAAPIAHGTGVGAEQFKNDVLQSKSNMVIASPHDVDRLKLRASWLAEARISVVLAEFSEDMTLNLRNGDGTPTSCTPSNQPTPNNADDIGILLFTSGTSGTKKLVPLSIHSMVCGVAMVSQSWDLSPSMRCLNQMPLNHVGGLVRNLFAPVFSGGSVICCSAFDANQFWDCVEDHSPTWYYASPSMHQAVLEASQDRLDSVAKSKIRLVCNAAGGLLPSLATALRNTFSTDRFTCTVLPSYGMTECMPISTPPLNYQLEKSGTSGVSVGPEIAILNAQDQIEDVGEIGRICVRGAPVFGGYQTPDGRIDASCFNKNGWFDTGDIGYLDAESYLYITGRSKEVINRGGELISPFEVEEAITAAASDPASAIFGRVHQVLAFSVAHDVLQEVVGVAVVTPDAAPRACLRSIQQATKNALNMVKIPVLIVYMRGGLPTNNNKVLRIRLSERLRLPEISDSTPHAERYYEAICPPTNTPLSVAICSTPMCSVRYDAVIGACKPALPEGFDCHVRPDSSDFYPELILAPRRDSAVAIDDLTLSGLTKNLSKDLHGYHMPYRVMRVDVPFPRKPSGEVDDDELSSILSLKKQTPSTNENTTERKVATIFGRILEISESDINSKSDFFDLGGSSMATGRLLSALRKEFNLRLPIDVLFKNREVGHLSRLINDKLGREYPQATEQGVASQTSLLPGSEKIYSSTNPILMLIQLIPIGLIYPMKRAFTWTIFMYLLSFTQGWPTNKSVPGRLFNLVISLTIGNTITRTIAPLLAILFKWLVIGRFAQGLYPMWSSHHTRWWMTEKIVYVCGKGIFGRFNCTRILYYRLLGTKIGRNVWIDEGATLGEWDLITIGDHAVLEQCSVRPFAAERNTSMYLGKISIGRNCSIGLCSSVAAGTSVPDNVCIGPNSSSWEIRDADESNRDLAASKVSEGHWLLQVTLGLPIYLITTFVGLIPWLACLVALVWYQPRTGVYDQLHAIIVWFASAKRVGFHYAAMAANVALGPVFFFGAFLAFKTIFDRFFGKLRPSSVKGRSAIDKFRRQLYNELMPTAQFQKVTHLFGGHYATTSILARALGAKVGERIYWPGTGPSVQDWDLLDIGNDVVFGGRSHLVTSDGISSDVVRIKSGAMVADRVVLLPGVEIGKGVVMGSGAVSKRNQKYSAGSTWVGSKRGNAVCLSGDCTNRDAATSSSSIYSSQHSSNSTLVKSHPSERSSLRDVEGIRKKPNCTVSNKTPEVQRSDINISEKSKGSTEHNDSDESSSPFGRAFYQGKAPYRVWNHFEVFIYSTSITICNRVYWNIGSISAVQIVARFFRDDDPIARHFLAAGFTWRPLALYTTFLALIVAIMAVQTIIALLGTIAAKWILMGRRRPGNYDWDKSPYCQRWQLLLTLETFRRSCYGGHGILNLLTGTAWLAFYFRALGARIGKDCALFAGGEPSVMFTEPDLLTLGDRVAIDDASLVNHINTRGKFDLNPLHVGARSVLRSGSRLLSGARMEDDSCLLEHTLVMAGDVIDAGCCAQGWPAEDFTANRTPTLEVARVWKVKD